MLTIEQQNAYQNQGYLLASGLIAPEIAAQAQTAMRRLLGIETNEGTSWADFKPGHQVYEEPALLACYTPETCVVAAQLAGEDAASFRPPQRAYSINVFPKSGEWRWPGPHIDHAIKEHGHRVFPRAFRVAAMTFLSDVPPHGGGTVVWPGSHRKLEQLAQSDPEQYDSMWALNGALGQIDLGQPVELTPRCGDVLFYHYLCAHAGSINVSDQPRLALNMKW